MKRRGLAIAAAIVLVPVVAVLAGEALGWPMLRAPLEAALARGAAVPVEVQGRFRARLLFGPRLEAGQLRIGAAHGLPAPHLLDGRDVALAWRWGDVWRWWRQGEPLVLRSLGAATLDLRLVRNADGRASWQIGRKRAAAASADARRDDLPRVGTLTVGNGRIAIDDAVQDTQMVVTIAGGEGRGTTQAGYRIRADGRWRAVPLALTGSSGGALPLLAEAAGDGAPAAIAFALEGRVGAARVAFDGRAAALFAGRALTGNLRVSAPSLADLGRIAGATLPQTPPFELTTRLAHDAGVWTLAGAQAAIGRSRLGGDLRYDTTRRPALLAGKLAGPRLALADLGPAVGAPPPRGTRAARPAERAPAGRVLPHRRFDLPSLSAMDADVGLAVDELDFGSGWLAPARPLRVRIVLDGGVLHLRGLEAATAGGRIAGDTSLDARADPARWRAKLEVAQVRIEQWLRGRPARYVSGVLHADLDLAGAGRSTAEILGSLDGRSRVTLRDGTISHLATEAIGLDVAQAIGVVIRGDRSLPLRCALFDLAFADGVVTPRTAVVDNRDSTLRAGGRIDLGKEALELVLRAQPKDFSPLALRTPITVTGTFAEPRVGIDGGPIAGKVVGAVVLGALVGPVAALLPLVDPGSGETPDPCAGPAAAPR